MHGNAGVGFVKRTLSAAGALLMGGLASPIFTAAQEGDGERLFRQRCAICHSLESGENKSGPHLANLVGRTAGSVEGASYSPALRTSGIEWDAGQLDAFLASPGEMVKGTRMAVKIGNAGQRAAIVNYLTGAAAP